MPATSLTQDVGLPAPLPTESVAVVEDETPLQRQIAAQADLIRTQAASLAHLRKILNYASAAAKIGVWECSLPDETLSWTDQVYAIFDMTPGPVPLRADILTRYSRDSLIALEEARSRAIAEQTGFNLDAEITTVKGHHRWIRVTATVESEGNVPARIFGMKQDITEEKLLFERMRYLADFDVLTGLPNRASFQARLAKLDDSPREMMPFSALLLVDLDGFKQINDGFGHAFGDECLRIAATRLRKVCAENAFVARIGGDEFAVLLGVPHRRVEIDAMAERIVAAMRGPVEGRGGRFKLSASVGAACIDPCHSSELFMRADTALYAAKAAGRDTFRMFKPEHGKQLPAVSSLPRARQRA